MAGRFVRELRAANRLLGDQRELVAGLRREYEGLGRTRTGPGGAPPVLGPDGQPAGGGSASINVTFRTEASSVLPGAPGAAGAAVGGGAGAPISGGAGASIGRSAGGGPSGRGVIGIPGPLADAGIDLGALAQIVEGIPPADPWDPRGLIGEGGQIVVTAISVLSEVMRLGRAANPAYLYWTAAFLARQALLDVTLGASGVGGGARGGARRPRGGNRYVDNGAGLRANLDNGAGLNANLDNGAGLNVVFGATTAAVKQSGDRTVAAIERLERNLTRALAGDGGAGLRADGGLA